jgi:hypothetical protein
MSSIDKAMGSKGLSATAPGKRDSMTDRAEEEKRVEREQRKGNDPHHALNQPASNPDPTEWPDPYERRPDPRGPETVDTPADPGARPRSLAVRGAGHARSSPGRARPPRK